MNVYSHWLWISFFLNQMSQPNFAPLCPHGCHQMAQAVASYNWWKKVGMNIMQLFTLSGIFLERCCSGLRLLVPFLPTHPHADTYYKGRIDSFGFLLKKPTFFFLLPGNLFIISICWNCPSVAGRLGSFFPPLFSTLRAVYLIRIFLSSSVVYSRAFVRAHCVCVCVQAVSGLLGKNAPPNTHRHTWTSGSRHDNIFFLFPPLCVLRTWEWRERKRTSRHFGTVNADCKPMVSGWREREQQPCTGALLDEFLLQSSPRWRLLRWTLSGCSST